MVSVQARTTSMYRVFDLVYSSALLISFQCEPVLGFQLGNVLIRLLLVPEANGVIVLMFKVIY